MTLELMLAMKFAAMVSPFRSDKKLIDAYDFRAIVRAISDIQLDVLKHLGGLVYPDGGTEILEKVNDVRLGKPIVL